MIRSRTHRGAARLLLGAFIAAYAMVSMHVYAEASRPAQVAAHEPAVLVEPALEKHCLEQARPQSNPAVLLCKFHCQSTFQTLDHPHASVLALPDAAVLLVSAADGVDARKLLGVRDLRAESTHHGGSPPLYSSTARRRI